MVRKMSRLVAMAGILLGIAVSLGAERAALAAPKAPPLSVSIDGFGLSKPIQLRGETEAERINVILDQVNWLSRAPQVAAPAQHDLGPRYTVVVFSGDVAKQKYDLYPLAKGGPRAYRPGRQPDGSRPGSAWFLGRVNMPEALRSVGAPLEKQSDPLSGGIGGGEQSTDEPYAPAEDLDQLFADLRRMLLLNAGVIVLITFGLAGIALLVRRRTR